MEGRILEVELRDQVGKAECRRLRRQARIPSVAYTRGQESIAISLPELQFTTLAKRSRPTQVFTLKSSDSRLDSHRVLVKEIRRDFVKNIVLHVDLQLLKKGEEIRVPVPVKVVGDSVGVKTQGGVMTIDGHTITVSCLPDLIPEEFIVDCTALSVGDRIRAQDIPLPNGVVLRSNPMETIVSIISSKQAEAAMAEVIAEADAAKASAAVQTTTATATPTGEAGADAAAATAEGEAADKGEKKES